MSHPMLRLTAISLALFPALDAQAQEANSPVPAPVATVSVAGTADSLRRNDTSTRIVMTRDEILKFGDTSVLDAMRRLPGVTVSGADVRMRGLGNGYTQVLVNGERPPAGFSIDSLPPESIERIEVMRAATAEFSTQAIAGTINIVLRRTADKAAREARLRTSHSQRGRGTGVNLTTSDKTDAFSYTVGMGLGYNKSTELSRERVTEWNAAGRAMARRSTSYHNDNDGTILNLNSRVQWKLGGADTLAWQAFALRGRLRGANDERTATELGDRYPFPRLDVRYRRDTVDLNTDVEWVAQFGETGRLSTKARAYSTDNARDMGRLARNDTMAMVLDRSYLTDTLDRGLSWTGKLSFSPADGHALAFGWDAGHSRYTEQERQDDVQLAGGPIEIDFDNSYRASISRLAMYVQDEWDVSASLSLYLGMRWEGVDIATEGEGVEADSHSRVLSPLMQLLWKLPGKDQVRFALTRTYKAPSNGRLIPRHFHTSFNSAVTPDFTGNPRLRPELAQGIDLAYEHYWKRGAMVSASATVRKIDGLVRSAVRFEGGRWLSYPENSGEATVRTIELEAKFPLAALRPKAPPVDMRASVSRNWSHVAGVPGPDNRLSGQPRWSANLGFDYKRQQFSGGASLALTAGGWTRHSFGESAYVSRRSDLEGYAAYAFTPKRQLRFTVANVLAPDNSRASRYMDDDGTLESRTVDDTVRQWRLQYEHKF
jgi:outer membrane receptor for ferrienterochelin and colicin